MGVSVGLRKKQPNNINNLKKEATIKGYELIEIKIDPEDITYSAKFNYVYVDDIYIVLKDLLAKFTNGSIQDDLNIKDKNGRRLDREEVRDYIRGLEEAISNRGNTSTRNIRRGALN